MTDVYIAYELQSYRQKLRYEIDKLQCQLAAAERKLEKLRLDILISLIMFLSPLLASILLGFLSFGGVIPRLLSVLLFLLWVIALPFTSFALVKSVLIWWKNRDIPGFVWQKPAILQVPQRTTQEAEISYIAEQKKLLWVLGRYFIYQERLQQLLERVENGDEALTLENIRTKLADMPFYEEIKPANPFSSKEEKKTGMLSVIIIIALCLLFFALR